MLRPGTSVLPLLTATDRYWPLLREAEIKKLKALQKQGVEAAGKIDSRLAAAQGERDEAMRESRRAAADVEERDATIGRLQKQLGASAGLDPGPSWAMHSL